MKKLDQRKQYQIKQVEATMAIEDMPVDDYTHRVLVEIASNRKTADQAIREIIKGYTNG